MAPTTIKYFITTRKRVLATAGTDSVFSCCITVKMCRVCDQKLLTEIGMFACIIFLPPVVY